jgi:mannose-6-phosphate isomerase-like protein (cupin superfamily)
MAELFKEDQEDSDSISSMFEDGEDWYPILPPGVVWSGRDTRNAWKLLNAVHNGRTEASLTEGLLELQGPVWDVKWKYGESDSDDEDDVAPQSILEVAKTTPGVEYKVVEILERKLQERLATSFYNKRINLQDKFSTFSQHWSPRVVAEMNDYQLKIAKVKGEFVWHEHTETDEVFLIIEGSLFIDIRPQGDTSGGAVGTSPVELKAGELCVVKKGDQHKPYCTEECKILLIEPRGVVNTGDATAAAAGAEERLTAENDLWV